jgi:hypothetical protein
MVYDGNRAFEVSRIFGHHGSTNGDGRACKFPKFVDVGETTAEGCVTTRDRLSCEATFGFKADPFKNKCNDMPRLYVITATAEPTAVILRRGPSRWYHVIQWDMHRDEFVHGAWVKGRIYEENHCASDGASPFRELGKNSRTVLSAFPKGLRSPFPRYRMIGLKQLSTPSIDCSAHKRLISFNCGRKLACVIGCVGAVYSF